MTHYPNPLFEQLFASGESAFGHIAGPDAADAIAHNRAAFTFSQERAPRDDRHASRGVRDQVTRRKSLQYEIESYVMPGASGAGAMPELLAAHALAAATSGATSVAASPSPTATSCAPQVMNAEPGDAVGLAVGKDYHVRVVTGAGDGVIAWTPPLPGPPAAASPIHGASAYRSAARPAHSTTLWRFLDGLAFAYPGCVGRLIEITLAAGNEARWRFEGLGADERAAAIDGLVAGINDAQTTIAVGDATRLDPGMTLAIGAERVLVTDVSVGGSEIRVTRGRDGTTAAPHLAGTRIEPAMPQNVVIAGTPVAGIAGRVIVNGSPFEITEAKLRIEEGVRARETFGTDGPAGFTHPARRQVTLALTGFFTPETAGTRGLAKRFMPLPVLVQAGNAPGATFAFYAPRFEPRIPEITSEAGREVPMELSGPCLEDEGDDEVRLIFA